MPAPRASSAPQSARPPRARRSELATPASSEKMCAKAPSSGADLVFLDLEDACAPAAKVGARATAVAALTGQDWGRTLRAVRINGIDTPWCHDDIIEVVTGAREALDVLMVPKARRARDVWWVDVLVTQLETKLGLPPGRIALEALIEDAEGLANAVAIARSSDRLEALIFGAGDLSGSLHARVDGNFDPAAPYPGDFWHFARAQVVTAARVAGIDAVDAPYPDYQDPDGYRRSAVQAGLLGFDGKWAIHPSQVPIANEVFSPTAGEVDAARRSLADYRAAEAEGIGAIGRGGRLVDAAHMRLAANVLHRARLAGVDGTDGTNGPDGPVEGDEDHRTDDQDGHQP
jgi:citrate lyase subunit beta / citryl-CoA lyase